MFNFKKASFLFLFSTQKNGSPTFRPEQIDRKHFVHFELHNRDGRVRQRLVEAIISIQNIASYGVPKIFSTPHLGNGKLLPPTQAFVVLLLEFRDQKPTPDRNLAFNFSKSSKMNKLSFKEIEGEENDEKNYKVPVLVWKGDLYGLGFNNYLNKWVLFNDFFKTTGLKIQDAKILSKSSNYEGDIPENVGPLPLSLAIRQLMGKNETEWIRAMKVIAVHFLETARSTMIRDFVEQAFEAEPGNEGWIYQSLSLTNLHKLVIQNWSYLSDAFLIYYYGGGWDPEFKVRDKYQKEQLSLTTVEEAERMIGVCAFSVIKEIDIQKSKVKFEEKMEIMAELAKKAKEELQRKRLEEGEGEGEGEDEEKKRKDGEGDIKYNST